MTHDARRLREIVECGAEIRTYIAGKSVDDFLEDRLLQRGVERLLMIIGEAAKHLSDATRAAVDQPWNEIIRLRDKGTHAYDSLSPPTLYRIATESVPLLVAAVERFLGRRQA